MVDWAEEPPETARAARGKPQRPQHRCTPEHRRREREHHPLNDPCQAVQGADEPLAAALAEQRLAV